MAAGVRAGTAGAGVGAQVGLARRDSPFRGGRYLGLAQALLTELPATMAALRAGDVSEGRGPPGAGACRGGGPPWGPGRPPAWTRPTGGRRTPSSARYWPGWGTGRSRPRR